MTRHPYFICVLAALTLGQMCTQQDGPDKPEPLTLPRVKLVTTRGSLTIELFTNHTSAATTFKELVDAGYYNNTIFHDVRQGKWIVGGQYYANMDRNVKKPLVNDSSNGLRNTRGRVSLYGPTREFSEGVPQFLINLADNTELDYTPGSGEPVDYTVIGRVVDTGGMSVADAIGNAPTGTRNTNDDPPELLSHVPQEDIIINDAYVGAGVDADAGPDLVGLLNQDVVLDGSGSESLYDKKLTYAWAQTGGASVTLTSVNTGQAKFRPGATGTYTFELTVTDEDGESDSDTVKVTIVSEPNVRLVTTKGDIVLEMYEEGAPITVANFLTYVQSGFYNGTIFHRVIAGFVDQGGGYLPDLTQPSGLRAPIVNEFDPSRPNRRGTISMARTSDLNSATSQFFINLVDNTNLDNPRSGYAVFGRVVEGMNVADDIARGATETREDPNGNPFDDVPVEDVVITSATIEARPPAPQFVTTASGLQYKDIAIGTGPAVTADSTIKVYYTGRLTDENGEIFDSSGETKTNPATFTLTDLILGWQEGLTNYDMRVGGTRVLIIPPELGYGAAGSPPDIPPNATLCFEIEVVEVQETSE
ncbi:MAG TPA: peptidylprolyl isomerase [Phycisphaerae bacterium]|nr:peptidylprolyl isomerase [Phycisphaerae bacterium]HRR83573.1 peptidylprolyl isomerase [Phycisphaerae bacterium]